MGVEKVRTYTELSRVCLKDNTADLLRVWYWLRHHDAKGSGWISLNTFYAQVKALDLTLERAKQLHRKGLGTWWSEAGDGIYITGLKKLAPAIGADTEGELVMLPAVVFKGLQTFRAFAYAAWFAKDSWRYISPEHGEAVGGKTVARETIEKLFGISPRTQRRYERLAGIKVTPQYGYYRISKYDVEHLPLLPRLEEKKRGTWFEDVDNDGVIELVWQVSNHYTTQLDHVGHRKRVRNVEGRNSSGQANRTPRRYYDTVRKAAVAVERKGEVPEGGLYAFRQHARSRNTKGRLLSFRFK